MKKLLPIYAFFAFTLFAQAQTVSFPDANFKNKLLTANPNNTIATDLSGVSFKIDSNNDGLIQLSEALQVKKLDLTSSSISNLTGIGSFTNLEDLNINANMLTSFNLAGLSNLTSLICSNNVLGTLDVTYLANLKILMAHNCHLSSINVVGMANLETLICSNNQLGSLNLTGIPHIISIECGNNALSSLSVNHLTTLQSLTCGNNQLFSLNVSNLVHLVNLQFNYNQLSTIDITHNPEIYSFDCSYNQLNTIDLANSTKLQYTNFGGNLFTELDFSHVTYHLPSSNHEYAFKDSPNLLFVNAKNGEFDVIHLFGPSLNCPNLHYICLDDSEMEYNLNYMQQSGVSNIQLNSYCNYIPGGTYNTINGHITIDADADGCDPNDVFFANVRLNMSNGTNLDATFTDTSGNYNFFNMSGNYTITPVIQNPEYFSISPSSATLNFPIVNHSIQTQVFCVEPIGNHMDVEITIIPLMPPRPGFDATYELVYKNRGNQVASGNVAFTFDDAVLDYVSANPPIDGQSTNNVSWNYSNLLPFESRSVEVTLNVNAPTEIPAVNIGDILNLVATVNPIPGDVAPANNVDTLCQVVVGSLDPNDKTCLEGGTISTAQVGDYLNYVIRFQNTGTAAAENIVVKDNIDATKFDISTLQLTTASHPQVTRITGNKVEFVFENINLPAAVDNESASHGYVAFKVKTKSNLVLGNNASNTANIYFDYNFPIITNTTSTTVSNLGTGDFENTSVSVYPNPVKNILSITAKDNITSIQLFDIQGRLVSTKLNATMEASLDLSQQMPGVYFVKVYTHNGIKVEKVLKQ
jgi:hypothetical protein